MLLEFRDLTLLFDGTTALTRLTATLRGEVIVLLGANGSGKTSVLKILAGITAPTSGAALIDGEEVHAGRKSWVSYLPQEAGFFPFLQHPARTLSLSMQFRGIQDPEAPRKILAALGLEEEDRSAEGFSGGMKQKLRIASALVHAPRLLLLDEPTTGLDTRERFRVLRLIERLRGRVSVVFATHDPHDATAVADAVLILGRGHAVAAGNPVDIAREAEGAVFEITIPLDSLPDDQGYEIVEAHRGDQSYRLRILGTPPPGARLVEPTLEDAYLLLTGRDVP
jgi:ABC-type multidrug transport system ATPase subunit